MDERLQLAIEAVRAAAKICRQIQDRLVSEDSLTKKDRSPVTIADYASQAIICKMLHGRFPEIPILGEEDARALRQRENKQMVDKINQFLPDWSPQEIVEWIDHGGSAATDYFWTVDPIDGTKGFLRGEQYAVALALLEKGQVEIGVLGCPNLPYDKHSEGGTIFYASRGFGSYVIPLDGTDKQINRVSTHTSADITRFMESVESGHANHNLQGQIMADLGDRAQSVRFDSQVKYAVLARGDAEVYLRLPNPQMPEYREKIWDHAAGALIVEEAGGMVTDIYGKVLDFSLGRQLQNNRGVIVSNGLVHGEILGLIQKYNS